MKSKLLNRTRGLIALGMSAGLLMGLGTNAYGKGHSTNLERKKDDPKKKANSNNTKTLASSLNNDAVKIFPDIVKRSMHVVAKDNAGREIDFFVFDLQGVIIQHFKMKEKDHIKIAGLARGKYIYRVFSGDEETASGHFEIK
jgi:hypothetical protein